MTPLKSKKEVLAWFGNRGVYIDPKTLKQWHWLDGVLYYVIHGGDGFEISDTDPGMVDLTHTHSEDGRAVLWFEPWGSVPINQSPLSEGAS